MSQEAEKMIQNTDASPLRDAALIVAGNQVERYEMAAYGSLVDFAQLLGEQECVTSLQKTVNQEKQADAKLTEVGKTQVNNKAAEGSAATAELVKFNRSGAVKRVRARVWNSGSCHFPGLLRLEEATCHNVNFKLKSVNCCS